MNDRRAVQVVCELYVDTSQPIVATTFHKLACKLMDELMELDGCDGNENIVDPTVSSDASKKTMTVEMYVLTDEPVEAVAKASAVVRTALHAAGASTKNWPRVTRMENSSENVGALVTC